MQNGTADHEVRGPTRYTLIRDPPWREAMESKLSCLSSLREEGIPVEYIQPHYKEAYRLAIYALVSGGREAYQEYLRVEPLSDFLSEEEVTFILENAALPVMSNEDPEAGKREGAEHLRAPSTYFPTESDVEVPDLDLGWPEVKNENIGPNITMLFNPPRPNTPTIKEFIRVQIQDARRVIAIAMDIFTDVDIFMEIVNATSRGVVVYILIDHYHFKSFLNMAVSAGIQIQDLKNLRVRTVKGQQYTCRSGAKFHGSMQQKFLLVDCKTVLCGTYSFMWSFEKINLSMVLVVMGQLVDMYDEEFRRLFARSTPPAALSQKYDPYSGRPFERRLSLDQVHIRSRARQLGLMTLTGQQKGIRYNNGQTLTRGLSIQDRLNQAHRTNIGTLVKVHSYGGDLSQIGNSMAHFKNVKDDSQCDPEKGRNNEDSLLQGRMNHYMQEKYCVDQQQLLPYSRETSLNRWKIDSYLNKRDTATVESVENLHLSDNIRNHNPSSRMRTSILFNSCLAGHSDHLSNMSTNTGTSPPGSLKQASPCDSPSNAQQQWTSVQLRASQTRLEEIRRKRFSFHEEPIRKYRVDLNQGSQRLSVFSALERNKGRLPEGGLDKRHSLGKLEGNFNQGLSGSREEHTSGSQQDEDYRLREQTYGPLKLIDVQRSVSQYDLTTKTEIRNPIGDWQKPLSRTTSTAQLGIKLKEPLLQPSKFRPTSLNIESSKALTSLIRIPEERDGPTRRNHDSTDQLANSAVSVLFKDKDKTFQNGNQVTPVLSVVWNKHKVQPDVSEKKQETLISEDETAKSNYSVTSSNRTVEDADVSLERMFHKDVGVERQRQNSFGSTYQNTGLERLKHSMQADIAGEQKNISDPPGKRSVLALSTSAKGSLPSFTRSSHNADGTKTDKEHQHNTPNTTGKSFYPRLSSNWVRRSFRKKRDQESVSPTVTLESQPKYSDTGRKQVYSRFESFVSFDKKPSDKTTATITRGYDRSLSARNPSISSIHSQTMPNENKLGRFIQRFGNLISKK
ncbi:protein FAM83B [Esox lucius]|uniref:protein FAM83B n=1 Tax=Esox lucius TaxID=8010 RepID=UPI001476C019|nr:protein FAM83B [Esox lucius]